MKRNKPLITFIHFINTYSILVALGSFSCYLFFSKTYGLEPNYIVGLGLALGVWFIYTLDHLLDGIQLKDKAATLRHKLHFTQKRRLIPLLIMVFFILIVLAFFVPSEYYRIVTFLSLLTGVHFIINYLVPARIKRLFFLKEVFIALVVAIGFCITPLAPVEFPVWPQSTFVLLKSLLLVNLTNLLTFSYFDREADESSQTLSIAALASERTILNIAQVAILASLVFSSFGLWQEEISTLVWLVFFAMQLSLFTVIRNKNFFGKEDRYRFYGDLIYVYPLVAMPFLS